MHPKFNLHVGQDRISCLCLHCSQMRCPLLHWKIRLGGDITWVGNVSSWNLKVWVFCFYLIADWALKIFLKDWIARNGWWCWSSHPIQPVKGVQLTLRHLGFHHHRTCLDSVLKMLWTHCENPFKMPLKCLENALKMPWKRLENALKVSWKCLVLILI